MWNWLTLDQLVAGKLMRLRWVQTDIVVSSIVLLAQLFCQLYSQSATYFVANSSRTSLISCHHAVAILSLSQVIWLVASSDQYHLDDSMLSLAAESDNMTDVYTCRFLSVHRRTCLQKRCSRLPMDQASPVKTVIGGRLASVRMNCCTDELRSLMTARGQWSSLTLTSSTTRYTY